MSFRVNGILMDESFVIYGTTAVVAAVHTVLGPDHYLPFAAMAQAGHWSRKRTIIVTGLCGIGHVLGSVLIGLIGVGLGWAVFRVEQVEQFRGDVAGWLLIGFGLIYVVWGLRTAHRNRPHSHLHVHTDGTVHTHGHTHHAQHLHVHASSRADAAGPWVLFTLFLFGPCEPLIPLLMYPIARGDPMQAVGVVAIFSAITLATMIAAVLTVRQVAERVGTERFARFGHAFAGVVILGCGIAVRAGW